MTAPQKALIYCRVNDIKQATEGDGLASQRTRCEERARLKGYEVAGIFQDTMTGGVDYQKRPGMTGLLAFLDAQPDERFVIVFDDPKRFARSTRFHIELREALRVRNATVECLNFKFEDTPEGEFIETIIAAQGQLERKQNGRQTAQKMKARMQNGYWVHNAPVGYLYRQTRDQGKILVHDPVLAPIVREAFEGMALGRFQTVAEVVRFFESCPQFPRSKRGAITQQRVVDVLTHPLYTGYICSEVYGLNWHKARHEPLISLETFERVQARRQGVAYASRRKNTGDAFALRGMVACAGCGTPLRSSISKGNGGHYAYYLCQTKGCDHYGKSIKRDKLEDDVGALLKQLQPSADMIALAKAMFRKAWDARCLQATEAIHAARRHIDQIDHKIEKLVDLITDSENKIAIKRYEEKIEGYA